MTVFGMKPIKVICAAALLLPTSLSMAESEGRPSADSKELEEMVIYSRAPEVRDYEYGMRLDIADVVAMEYFPPEPDFCGVIPAQMTYEDSSGNLNTIRYLYPETAGCHDN